MRLKASVVYCIEETGVPGEISRAAIIFAER